MKNDDPNKKKPKLVFSKDQKAESLEKPPEDTYFEDTAKAISESKIAIDSYEDDEGGDSKSERFQAADKKSTADK